VPAKVLENIQPLMSKIDELKLVALKDVSNNPEITVSQPRFELINHFLIGLTILNIAGVLGEVRKDVEKEITTKVEEMPEYIDALNLDTEQYEKWRDSLYHKFL
jgi:hypothetical protein